MDEVTEYFYDLSLDGFHDEETGSSIDGSGWHAIFRSIPEESPILRDAAGAILHEDTQGFKDSDVYDTAEELEAAWQELLDEAPEDEE